MHQTDSPVISGYLCPKVCQIITQVTCAYNGRISFIRLVAEQMSYFFLLELPVFYQLEAHERCTFFSQTTREGGHRTWLNTANIGVVAS